jgi:hypothetical protein
MALQMTTVRQGEITQPHGATTHAICFLNMKTCSQLIKHFSTVISVGRAAFLTLN